MFKGIDIKLAGPICDCDEMSISWYIISGPGLGIKCNTCQTELRIPHGKFRAGFVLEKSYPGKKKNNSKKTDSQDPIIEKKETKPEDDKILEFKLDPDIKDK